MQNARFDTPEARQLFDRLERRIHGLNPVLRDVRITHRWMGPIGFATDDKPIIMGRDGDRVLIATGYRGHGVALSVRVGKLLAEVLAGTGQLPVWDAPDLQLA